MAVEQKRKSGDMNGKFGGTKKSLTGEERPNKRPRQDNEVAPQSEKKPRSINPTSITKISNEDAAFPRGGASVLTPLEHKQIAIEATKDVLFEQTGAKVAEDGRTPVYTKNKRTGNRRKSAPVITEKEKDEIVIEGINYKRLFPGSLVLGQVAEVNMTDIAVALPNNLTGYCPITSISPKLTEKMEKLAEMEEDEEDDSYLQAFPKVGQYLRCCVVSTSDDKDVKSEKAKRRIELSIMPQQANMGLTKVDIVVHNFVQASVLSVEDHGLIMDIGIQEDDVKGFMGAKDIGRNISTVVEGTVFLCMITGLSSNSRTVKLSADISKIAVAKKTAILTNAPTIDSYLPGVITEALITETTSKGVIGKIDGLLNATADLMHSGAGADEKDMDKKYKIGSKVRCRVVCTFPRSEPRKIGVSLLPHILALEAQKTATKEDPLSALPLSKIVKATVIKVEPGIGLFVDLGVKGVKGFVHISRVQDGKIETLSETSGPYKLGTEHQGRIIGNNRMDGVFLVSLEEKILSQHFLRIEDVRVGEVIKDARIEKLIVNSSGIGGVLINLSEGISGMAPEIHLADVKLAHPERVFKEGAKVTCRVLSTDPLKRQIRLTLKKSLITSEVPVWTMYTDISPGSSAPGTIINISGKSGAVIQFFGNIRGFLPVSEMSEAFISDPSEHFRLGQTLTLFVKDVDVEAERLTVSCKDPSSFGTAQQERFRKLKLGEIVSGTVLAKSANDISIELTGGLRAILAVGHLTDNSEAKNASALKKIRVSQIMTDLVVLEKRDDGHVISLSNKQSLRIAASSRTLLRSFEDVKENKVVAGFVKNLNPSVGVFVQFAGGLTGLVARRELSAAAQTLPEFGLRPFQSIMTKIISIDQVQQRFYLSMKQVETTKTPAEAEVTSTFIGSDLVAINPIDESIKTVEDITIGKVIRAKIASVKDTQINVQLADNIQGRVDVSSVFDNWKDIADRKTPLASFHKNEVISVRVLGIHDARNHRFLPISHRGSKNVVYELSAKASAQVETTKVKPLTLDKVIKGSSYIAYVNNVGEGFLYVNLSPNVRGRIQALEVSDDVSLLSDLEANFPVGSAIRVVAIHIDVANNRLDLSARSTKSSELITFEYLSKNQILPGKVTKVSERQIMVQLSDAVSAPVHLVDLADDYSEANPLQYKKNDIIRVCVTSIDRPNKRITLSTRPSRVLSSSLPVKDKEVTKITDLKKGEICRGFVKAVASKGLFVNIGSNTTAYVKVSDLSDQYLKDWQNDYQVDQLVRGKVIVMDEQLGHVQLSLKESVLDENYVPPITFDDLQIGQIVTGRIRKVEDFGVFIVVDKSQNVSGLCHKSEIADAKVDDIKKLYTEGDLVKAIVLKLDQSTRRVSFGLKISYLEGGADTTEESDTEIEGGALLGEEKEEEEEDVVSNEDDSMDVDEREVVDAADSDSEDVSDDDEAMSDAVDEHGGGVSLSAGGFDWLGNLDQDDLSGRGSDVDVTDKKVKKRKKSKPSIKVDRTGDLDVNGPQTATDFERLILGQPDSSMLWIQYAAHFMKLSELPRAREVLNRALSTISIREETEKFNIWIALLNLENTFGTDETLVEAFTRACQYNDAQEVYERLSNIYIQSQKNDKADELFTIMIKKFSQSPEIWINYATFLMTTLKEADRARALLSRATQSLPPHTHLSTTLKFANLEFRSPNGSPERGRTIFEGVLSLHPKKTDIWSQLLSLEMVQGDKEIIRGVFERVTRLKSLKAKAAKDWFKKWSEWEVKAGDKKSQERVTAKAEEWVRAAALKTTQS